MSGKTTRTAQASSRSQRRDPDRRRAILEAAGRIFLELGFGGATVDEVIRRVGGSKRTVYSYFSSKEALFIAVIDEVVGQIVQPLPDIDALSLDVRETLMHVAQQHMETVLSERHIALVRLVASESVRFPQIGRAYYEHGPARGHAKLELYFARQHRQGTLQVPDPRRAAEHFWGMLLHHETLQRLYHVAPPPRASAVRAACSACVDAFLSQHAVSTAGGAVRS
ncbi:MAG TPA: TetR/AcrR family transcriptional regulator [Steroidobacteraceae bacterium]|nr:TetR/AcrR family transcriptional regulator [Steroidobacteraceae bacterium]